MRGSRFALAMVRPVAKTRTPASARPTATPRPTPRLAPVTSATCSRSSAMVRRCYCTSVVQLAQPDVAVAHRIPVILQAERTAGVRGRVRLDALVRGRTPEGARVVDEDAVVKDGDHCGRREHGAVEARRRERDVVR